MVSKTMLLFLVFKLGSSVSSLYKYHLLQFWLFLSYRHLSFQFKANIACSNLIIAVVSQSSGSAQEVVSYQSCKMKGFSVLFKGQIISKGLFGVLEFSQNLNEWICRSSKNEFVCSFFGRIRRYQKSFRNYLTFRLKRK